MAQQRSRPGRRLGCAVVVLLTCLLMVPLTAAAEQGVAVYYFHGTLRCGDCLRIEQLAETIVREDFSQALTQEQLWWRPYNVDLPENVHFVSDFDLNANELVVARVQDGEPSQWQKIPEVWALAWEPEKFRRLLIAKISQALASR